MSTKTYSIKFYGETYKVRPYVTKYRNGRLAILLEETSGEPFADLTVNLVNEQCPKDCAFLDTNNFREGEEFVRKNRLGTFTGIYGHSGYCSYPLYRFDMDALTGKKKEKTGTPFGL